MSDYCIDNKTEECNKTRQAELVRVAKFLGEFKLETDSKGATITLIQDTNPCGNLPSLLANQLVEVTPYNTFKKLSKIVKLSKYKNAKLIYNNNSVAIDIRVP
ncbi:MAG: hypothetical protein OQL19_01080 [Gammaproteobacteria bacterium]|nr:hypothetical protein [Gammaproteobacteria bacterium]